VGGEGGNILAYPASSSCTRSTQRTRPKIGRLPSAAGRKSTPGPCPARRRLASAAPFSPYATSTLHRAPKTPAKIDQSTRRSRWEQRAHWNAMGEKEGYPPGPATSCCQHASMGRAACAIGPDIASQSPPRTRFARARVPRAFTRFFAISCRRFEISIRRPEAHFARGGSIGDNCLAAALMAAPVSCCAGRLR
jgi:hypothetical protein